MELKQFPREKTGHADALANIASAVHLAGKRTIAMEFLLDMSILESLEMLSVKEER